MDKSESERRVSRVVQKKPVAPVVQRGGLAEGTTTKSLILKPSYYRTDDNSQDVRQCPDANLGEGASERERR